MLSHQFGLTGVGMQIIQAFRGNSHYPGGQHKSLNKSCPRIITSAFPNSCLGATLWWDSFCHISKGTAVAGAHFLLCKGYQQHPGDWWWLMLSKFNASSNCLDCAQGQFEWKLVTPSKLRLCTKYSLFYCICFSSSCCVYSILITAFLSLCFSLDSSYLFQAVRPKQDINSTKFDPKLNFWAVSYLSGLEIRSKEFLHTYFIKMCGLSSLFIISKIFKS